jgi:hypothetical protein
LLALEDDSSSTSIDSSNASTVTNEEDSFDSGDVVWDDDTADGAADDVVDVVGADLGELTLSNAPPVAEAREDTEIGQDVVEGAGYGIHGLYHRIHGSHIEEANGDRSGSGGVVEAAASATTEPATTTTTTGATEAVTTTTTASLIQQVPCWTSLFP